MALDPSTILSGGSPDMPATSDAGSFSPDASQAPQPQAAPAQPASSGKPSLFRQILAGAFMGMAAGMGVRTPGAAAAAGSSSVLQQQQLQHQYEMQQQQLQMRQQQVANQTAEVQSRSSLEHAQAAKAIMDMFETSRNMQYLDKEKQAQLSELQANTVKIYNDAGMQLLGTVKDDPQSLQGLMQHYQQTGQNITDPIVVHNSADGQVYLYQRDPSKVLDKDTAKELNDTYGMKLVPGMPFSTVTNLLVAKQNALSNEGIAKMDAQNRLAVAGKQGENALAVAGLETAGREAIESEQAKQQEIRDLSNKATALLKLKSDHEIQNVFSTEMIQALNKSYDDTQNRLNALQSAPSKSGGAGDRIRVKRKSDGMVGSILKKDFDPNKYVQQLNQ